MAGRPEGCRGQWFRCVRHIHISEAVKQVGRPVRSNRKIVRQTTERFVPDEAQSPDELAIALLHLYAYDTAAALVRPGDRVLDVGFGEGYGSRILSIAGGKYQGLELDPVAVEHASARYEARFETYDGLSIPAERRSVRRRRIVSSDRARAESHAVAR